MAFDPVPLFVLMKRFKLALSPVNCADVVSCSEPLVVTNFSMSALPVAPILKALAVLSITVHVCATGLLMAASFNCNVPPTLSKIKLPEVVVIV